jgi:hypothetical protein
MLYWINLGAAAMKKLLVVVSSLAVGFVVLDGIQVVKAPTGLTVKPGQALAADMVRAPPPAPAPVGKGKAPIIGKGKGKAPVVTRG